MATTTKPKGGIFELVKTIVYALLLAGLIRTLFFQPFWIPSGSMKPTLLIGDFLFVNKMAYGYSRYSCPFALCPIEGRILARMPHRGDVVVFKHPTNGTDYIKRLIGLPGDTIQMIEGRLYINGAELPQSPDGTFVEKNEPQGPMANLPRCENRPVAPGGDCEAEQLKETLPEGKVHEILNIEDGFGDNTPVFTVPADEFFFMGDNRDNSMDSRFPRAAGGVGFVPFENLVGRADRVIFSSAGPSMLAFWTWRPDRFFKAINLKLSKPMDQAAERLGHRFANPDLLIEALTHPSLMGQIDNQRLEFLGDRVLGLVIAEALLTQDSADEGKLAPRLNALVRKETCAEIATALDLGAALRMGRSEMLSGGRRKTALLGDAMEAVIAAVYLDAGYAAARALILRHWARHIAAARSQALDAKTALQEWAQARGLQPPAYNDLERSGPDHAPVFLVEAKLADGRAAEGRAPSKRAAQQQAAEALLSRLEARE